MRFSVLALLVCVPVTSTAQPAQPRESITWRERLAIGTALFAGGYARSVVWASQSASDDDALYVPVLGPWVQLFGYLPDCRSGQPFCSYDSATRTELVIDGVVQLAGVGFVASALIGRHHREPVRVAPLTVAPMTRESMHGMTVSGSF
jgi:hypothetical protein